jgi:hypothetical protein
MIPRNIKRRYLHILFQSDLEATRLLLSWGALFWALMLFWPGDTFGRPTYTIMGHYASEHVWATAFLLQGAVMMYSLLFGYKSRITLVVDAVLGCVLWTVSCLCMLASVYPPPAAISAEICAAVASWWVLVRYHLPSEKARAAS